MNKLDKIVNLVPLTVMGFVGCLTFLNHTTWFHKYALQINCITGYSLVFCLFSLYLSLKYVKKLIVEIPLITLTLSSLTMAILQPKTAEDIEIVYLWDMGYMCLMFVAFFLIVHFKFSKKDLF